MQKSLQSNAHKGTKQIHKLININRLTEGQPITSGIKHWGLSGYSSVLPRIKFGVTGQVSSPQSPTISYRRPLAVMPEKDSHKLIAEKNEQN